MVLMDEKGDTIAATIKKNLMPDFEGLLTEGSVYMLSKFSVADSKGHLKMSKHKYHISFQKKTVVKAVTSGFPSSLSRFSFVEFNTILHDNLSEDYAINIIGVVTAYTDLIRISAEGRTTKRVSFELQDVEMDRLRCTLWGEHTDQFHAFTGSMRGDEHVIVIIQLGRLRTWQGRPAITNCFFGTRVLINTDDKEVLSFRKSLVEKTTIPFAPEKLLDFESLNIDSTLHEFAPDCDRILACDFIEIQEATRVVFIGTVTRIQDEQLWYFIACRKCHRGVETGDANEFSEENNPDWKCVKCEATGSGYAYRYKIQVRVRDPTGSVSLVLFDREAARLLKISAYDLFKSIPSDVDHDVFPEKLNELVGKTLVLKVEVSDYNLLNNYPVYTVSKLSDDSRLLASVESTPDAAEVSSDTNTTAGDSTGTTPANSPKKLMCQAVALVAGAV